MSFDLPVLAHMPAIIAASRRGPLILTAPPGSGKTTLVSPAVLDDVPAPGTILLVQPRRVAARSIARRIAQLRGCEVGGEVGYQVRFDQKCSRDTRLIVATTGILLRRLVDQVELPGIAAVVLDEFHERSLELDLALGMLVRLTETIRPDLRLVIMSATMPTAPLQRLLPAATVLDVPGRAFPVEIRYQPRRSLDQLEVQVGMAVEQALQHTTGDVLVFLPGVGEIARSESYLAGLCGTAVELLRLHGEMSPVAQDRIWQPTARRKVILSTNIAETSLTLEGVTAVVDSGLARSMHTDPAVGLPRLQLSTISRAAAEQRAGRAGRVGPGICWRLWESAAHAARPAYELPEILRSELSGEVLQLLHWGERSIADFPWLDPPPAAAVEQAVLLLQRLEAIDSDLRLTPAGLHMVRMPVHPRLARLLLTAQRYGEAENAALAAGLLAERDPFRVGRDENRGPRDRRRYQTKCDITDRVQWLRTYARDSRVAWNKRPPETPDEDSSMPARDSRAQTPGPASGRWLADSSPVHFAEMPHLHRPTADAVLQTAERLLRSVPRSDSPPAEPTENGLARAILAAFPDRVAKLRPGATDRGVLVGGRGVRIDPQASAVRPDILFVCVDIGDKSGDAIARAVTAIDAAWLPAHLRLQKDELFFNPSRGQVEARRRQYYLDLLLDETPIEISDWNSAAAVLAVEAGRQLERILPAADDPAQRFRRRIAWLAQRAPELELPTLDDDTIRQTLPTLVVGLRSLAELRKADWLGMFQQLVGGERLALLERLAPSEWVAPSGSRFAIEYDSTRPPTVAVRIQEIFGLAATPRIAGGRVPLNLELLGPNYRPQQRTNDLESFWKNTYPEIKKELRRRYPKHAWPDDPLAARPIRSGLKRDAQAEDA